MTTSGDTVRDLVLSNMFPTLRSPGQGIFISRHLASHRDAGDGFTAVAVRPTLGKVVGAALAMIVRSASALVGTDFVNVPVPTAPADRFLGNIEDQAFAIPNTTTRAAL